MKVYLLIIWLVFAFGEITAKDNQDYSLYHANIARAEEFAARQEFEKALEIYSQTFQAYDFVFLRDCKVAVQIAWYTGNESQTLDFLRLGIAHGWEKKSLKKNTFLKELQRKPLWAIIKNQYDSISAIHDQRINHEIRTEVRKMFVKDQKLAIGALFRIGQPAQDRYAERKFAPNSLKQVMRLNQLLDAFGYPGEKLIGNDFWMSTILSHSNSISKAHNLKDTVYQYLRPKLLLALNRGEISPYEIAMADNWKTSVESGGTNKSYGYLDYTLTEETAVRANNMRSRIGLRSIETRNQLLDVQAQTGINFYLPERPKPDTKITVVKSS